MRGLRERPLDFIVEMSERFGDLVHFESQRNPIFFVNHPDLVREVLVARPQTFVRADVVCNVLRIFDGESVLVAEGDQWRQQRRLLQEGFRAERLRVYAREAAVHTRAMLRRWPNSGTIHVRDEMEELCVKVLSSILLGTQPPPDFVESIRVVLDARAFETGKAIASERMDTANSAPEAGPALNHVHRFLDELICVRRTPAARSRPEFAGHSLT